MLVEKSSACRRDLSKKDSIKFLEELINLIALRKAKIVYNFGLSEGNRVKLKGPVALPVV